MKYMYIWQDTWDQDEKGRHLYSIQKEVIVNDILQNLYNVIFPMEHKIILFFIY